MIVRCASCDTEFALDDRQVGPGGATVRCSHCSHVFRVAAPAELAAQPWQVRTIDDLLFTAPDLATLRAWILEGRLHPDDRVSRSGRHFVRLGEMAEFADAFAGFAGLPGVLVAEAERGASENSALDVLGPPPAFGTHAGDETDAALAGVPEPTPFDRSSMLDAMVAQAGTSSTSIAAAESAPVGVPQLRPREGSDPAREPDAPSPSRPLQVAEAMPMGRRATPVPSAPPSRSAIPETGRGVPMAVPDDRGSRPMSMLDVVTHHVRPITQPIMNPAARTAAPPPPPPPPPRSGPEPAPPAITPTPAFEPVAAPRGRGGAMVWAALGLLAGAAVVFGIPQVRARVFGSTPAPVEVVATVDDGPLVTEAKAAIASADPQTLARADAVLQAAIGSADAATAARLRIAAAEVLATRALTHELWAAAEPAMRSDARFWAQEDAGRAIALLGQLDAAAHATDPSWLRAQALLRVVQGRADASGLALDPESALLVASGPLLRDNAARLPEVVRAGLLELKSPSVLARLVLALGQIRAGALDEGRKLGEAVLAEVPGQPVARAMVKLAGAGTGKTPPDEGKAPTTPPDDAAVVVDSGGDAPPPVPAGESPERLIDRGCSKAEAGDAAGAVPLLRKALEKRPNDVDALLCLGDAHSKLGAYDAALKQYERALGRSPNMMSALQGAAKAAAKLGRKGKALQYYERLLEHDPSHAQARAFVDANKAGDGGAGADNG